MKNNSKSLKRTNKERVNEEISMEQVGMIVQALTVFSPHTKTISLQQAMNQYGTPETKFDIKISVARTSEHEVYYNLPRAEENVPAIQDNLPTDSTALKKTGQPTHYLKGTKEKYKLAIQQGLPVFYYFEYITEAEAKQAGAKKTTNNLGTDITDFLKIGSEMVNEKGALTINLTDNTDSEIIASGNGLYLLVRTAANNQKELDKNKTFVKMNVMEMKSAKVDADNKFEDTNFLSIKTNSDKQSLVKEYIYLLFTMSSKEYNDIIKKPSSTGYYLYEGPHGTGLPGIRDGQVSFFKNGIGEIVKTTQFGPERDELVKDALTGQLFLMNDWLYPISQNVLVTNLKSGKFKVMSRSNIQSYLDKFDEAKTETERDAVVVDFMTKAMNDYKENFMNMVDNFAKEMGVTKEQILKEFDIEKGVNETIKKITAMLGDKNRTEYKTGKDAKTILGAFSYVKTLSNTMGTKPGKTDPGKLPFKDIETAETEVKVGETKYQIRTKTASTNFDDLKDVNLRRGLDIKKESFRYLKTFEGFRRGRR